MLGLENEALPHSQTLTSLHLRHSSFSSLFAALPMSQLILQPFRCFTYVIGTSPTSPCEPPMPLWWCLIYPWWFCNLQWLRTAGLYEICKLALELKKVEGPWFSAKQRGTSETFRNTAESELETAIPGETIMTLTGEVWSFFFPNSKQL